ncbi:MAG: hypothetical protein M0004_04130 [Actinomycetota bacterium]|nr:hypothetical protein [Actinomycetota bacterium]
MPGVGQAREWASFEDPSEDRTWLVDIGFLASPWRCLFGQGCQGVLTAPAPELEQGCCSYGAHFTGEDDVARVEAEAARLTAEQWQHRAIALRRGVVRRTKRAITTRMVDGACIFLNRPGFAGGSGCALHRAALEAGRRPLELKPEVCWQLPLRREDTNDPHGHVVSMLGPWERRHWGEGGEEFAWWCSEAPEAFAGAEPVYRSLRDELVEMCGNEVYALVAAYLDERCGVLLPHPVLRGARRRRHSGAPSSSASS